MKKCAFEIYKNSFSFILVGFLQSIFLTMTSFAQFTDLPVGSRAIGMGTAFVAIAQGPEAVYYNPAGLTQSEGNAFSLFSAMPFGLKELQYHTFSSSHATVMGSLGFSIRTFGNQLYRENLFTMGWGFKPVPKLSLGLSAKYNHLTIEKYESRGVGLVDAGLLWNAFGSAKIGCSISNLSIRENQNSYFHPPIVTRMGISYTLSNYGIFAMGFRKEKHFQTQIVGGFEITPYRFFAIRTGFSNTPSLFYFGLGFGWKKGWLDCAWSIHPVLGMSYSGSIRYELKQMEIH